MQLLNRRFVDALEQSERYIGMAVHIEWDSEDRHAIVWTLIGRWTWDEYAAAWSEMITMLDTAAGKKPDIIFDVRRMTMLPPDVITRMKKDYLNIPPAAGRMLAVGVDVQLQLFWNTFTDLPYASHLKATYFETLEEAIEFARSKDS